jgi:hypothetical protein
MSEHLFIVARRQPQLYGHLSHEFSAEADVRVIVDRRQRERRHGGERRSEPRGDRRQIDRRSHQEVGQQITSLGYAFVRLQ